MNKNRQVIIEYKIGFNEGISKSKIRDVLSIISKRINESIEELKSKITFKVVLFPTFEGDGKIESKILFDSLNKYDLDITILTKKIDSSIQLLADVSVFEEREVERKVAYLKGSLIYEVENCKINLFERFLILLDPSYFKRKIVNKINELNKRKLI